MPASRSTATTTPATSSGWTSRASGCSTSTGPSSITGCSTCAGHRLLLQLVGGPDDGDVRLDKAAIFLRAYQDEAAKFEVPGPLSADELALLPRMVANANLYILNWDLMAYYDDPGSDVDEYLTYLGHQVQFMEYIEAHQDELAHIAEEA